MTDLHYWFTHRTLISLNVKQPGAIKLTNTVMYTKENTCLIIVVNRHRTNYSETTKNIHILSPKQTWNSSYIIRLYYIFTVQSSGSFLFRMGLSQIIVNVYIPALPFNRILSNFLSDINVPQSYILYLLDSLLKLMPII